MSVVNIVVEQLLSLILVMHLLSFRVNVGFFDTKIIVSFLISDTFENYKSLVTWLTHNQRVEISLEAKQVI